MRGIVATSCGDAGIRRRLTRRSGVPRLPRSRALPTTSCAHCCHLHIKQNAARYAVIHDSPKKAIDGASAEKRAWDRTFRDCVRAWAVCGTEFRTDCCCGSVGEHGGHILLLEPAVRTSAADVCGPENRPPRLAAAAPAATAVHAEGCSELRNSNLIKAPGVLCWSLDGGAATNLQ